MGYEIEGVEADGLDIDKVRRGTLDSRGRWGSNGLRTTASKQWQVVCTGAQCPRGMGWHEVGSLGAGELGHSPSSLSVPFPLLTAL